MRPSHELSSIVRLLQSALGDQGEGMRLARPYTTWSILNPKSGLFQPLSIQSLYCNRLVLHFSVLIHLILNTIAPETDKEEVEI